MASLDPAIASGIMSSRDAVSRHKRKGNPISSKGQALTIALENGQVFTTTKQLTS